MTEPTVESVERRVSGRGTVTLYTVKVGEALLVVNVTRAPGERIQCVSLSVVSVVGVVDCRWIRDVLTSSLYAPGSPFGAGKVTEALAAVAAELSAETARVTREW
jgi:hypothetical protein